MRLSGRQRLFLVPGCIRYPMKRTANSVKVRLGTDVFTETRGPDDLDPHRSFYRRLMDLPLTRRHDEMIATMVSVTNRCVFLTQVACEVSASRKWPIFGNLPAPPPVGDGVLVSFLANAFLT